MPIEKQEFPTFLNEQPTVIFGRTSRELLILVIGAIVAFSIWSKMSVVFPTDFLWNAFSIIVAVIPGIAFAVIALVNIGDRPMEEWIMAWLFFSLMPKIYLFEPIDEEDDLKLLALEHKDLAKSVQKRDLDSMED